MRGKKEKSTCRLHIYIYIYIYIYISERIKEDASILCYSEFRAQALVRQNSALLPQHWALYAKVDSTPTFIYIDIYLFIYLSIYLFICLFIRANHIRRKD